MQIFFGYRTAELLLNQQRIELLSPSFDQELERCCVNKSSIESLATSYLYGLPRPYDVLVPTQSEFRRVSGVKCHLCRRDLPANSFINMGDNVFVASPQLCFVQRAAEYTLAQTVAFGARLCGTFALDKNQPSGIRRRSPLATLADLRTYVDSCPRMRGIVNARRALSLIPEGSASPMETITQMVFCYPRRLRGLGLPTPQMNYVEPISQVARGMIDKDYIRIDLYWPDAAFGLEYQGDFAHSSNAKIASDISRQLAAERMGIELQMLTIEQLRNESLKMMIARKIASRLGVSLDVDGRLLAENQRLIDELIGMLPASHGHREDEMRSLAAAEPPSRVGCD
ncbi:MAG: hypothetical protein J6I30_06665 [Pseudomonas sp.]|nr:hypothetical protein [Pseudomonas sp.]